MILHLIRLTPNVEVATQLEATLAPGASLTVGRAALADLHVPSLSVGHYVVRLTHTPAGVWAEDLASGGGSALEIDGERIERPNMLLPDGAVLWVGGVGFGVKLRGV